MSLADALRDGRLNPADLGTQTWVPQVWWRVYPQRYGATGYNDTRMGNARFSPLEHAGAIVPTIYAGTTVATALMETVLHDVPTPSAGFILRLSARTDKRAGSFRPADDLVLADFSSVGLRRLGLGRPDVIDSDKPHYPITRQLAQWVYANRPDIQGIVWTSRQHDEERAILLFEPRLAGMQLHVQALDEPIVDGPHLGTLMDLLERLGAGLELDP